MLTNSRLQKHEAIEPTNDFCRKVARIDTAGLSPTAISDTEFPAILRAHTWLQVPTPFRRLNHQPCQRSASPAARSVVLVLLRLMHHHNL